MRKIKRILAKKSGRGYQGRVTVRHQGGRSKRFLREIDFKRNKIDIWARVETVEFDPNRNARISLLMYSDGERRYILSPNGLKVGDKVISSLDAPIEKGNTIPLKNIPVGTQIHNIEIKPDKGGQIVRSAGSFAVVHGKEENFILIKLSSGEIKRFNVNCRATIGQVGNLEARSERLDKAGRKRNMGIRPTVRGTAQNPRSHPHGGGEGRSGVGMKHPKTPYGRAAVGKTRRRRKYSDKMIISPRRKGSHS